jgi:hypothetical protein
MGQQLLHLPGMVGIALLIVQEMTHSLIYILSHRHDSRIIIVTSTDKNDNHTFFENGVNHTHSHFPEVDICAPGYDVMGADRTSIMDSTTGNCVKNPLPYYGSFGGTSFATPIVAGVCALMKSVNSSLTPWAIQDIIKMAVDPVNDAYLYPGLVGAGRINAYKAVKVADCDFSDFPSPSINGSDIVCSSNSTFILIHRLPGSMIEWLHSNNTIQVGSHNTENYTIKGNASFPADSGWVKAILHKPGCGTDTLKKSFWVGKVPAQSTITGNSKIGCERNLYVANPGFSNSYNSVQWSVAGPLRIVGPSGGFHCTVQGTNSGMGWVYFTTTNTCGSSRAELLVEVNCWGFNVYPNPATSILTIESVQNDVKKTDNTGIKEVYLYNKMMKPLLHKQFNGKSTTLDVNRLKPDVYLLRVKAGDKVFDKKITVSRK